MNLAAFKKLLLLFTVFMLPCQVMASKVKEWDKRFDLVCARYRDGDDFIRKTNKEGLTDEEKKGYLREAKSCYEKGIEYLEQTLADIHKKSEKKQKKKKYRKETKRCNKNIATIKARIDAVDATIDILETAKDLREAKPLYEESAHTFMSLNDRNRAYTRSGEDKAIQSVLQELIQGYQQGEQLGTQAKFLIDNVAFITAEDKDNKEIAAQLTEAYAAAISALENELQLYIALKQKKQAQLNQLKQDAYFYEGFEQVAYEFREKKLTVIDQLLPLCDKEDKQTLLEQKQLLEEQQIAFKEKADLRRLFVIEESQSGFEEEEKKKREAFFSEKARYCAQTHVLPWQLQSLNKPGRGLVDYIHSDQIPPSLKPKEKVIVGLEAETGCTLLDDLILELGRDPVLIAQYVHNEIELVDVAPYREAGDSESVPARRSPLMTYLARKGSPIEQCELLAYLLKGAGYLSARVERCGLCTFSSGYAKHILGLDEEALEGYYPWVELALHGIEEPIRLFPWMQDVKREEGFDIYDFLPDAYASASKWVHAYLSDDEQITRHIGPDRDGTVALLFIRHLQAQLTSKGLSLDDVGLHLQPVKKQYESWQAFPRPKYATRLSSECDELESYIEIRVFSKEDPCRRLRRKIKSTELGVHGVLVQFRGRTLSLGEDKPYHLTLEDRDTVACIQVRHYFATKEGVERRVLGEHIFCLPEKTTAMVCCHLGGASPYVLDQFRRQFLHEEDETKKIYRLLSFVGAGYFEKCAQGEDFLAKLHKVAPPTSFACGLVKLATYEGLEGAVPQVDMMHLTDPYSYDFQPAAMLALDQLRALLIANTSSNEHQILRDVFHDPFAISSVKLLQKAHQRYQAGQGEDFSIITPETLSNLEGGALSEAVAEFFKGQAPFDEWNYAYLAPKGEYEEAALLMSLEEQRAWMLSKGVVINGGEGSEIEEIPNPYAWDPNWSLGPRVGPLAPGSPYANQPLSLSPFYPSTPVYFDYGPYFSPAAVDGRTLSPDYLNYAPITPIPSATNYYPYYTPNITQGVTSDIRPDNKAWMAQVADPVDTITGAFYIDEQDMILPGPFPLPISRNYNSQNLVESYLGWGWKLSIDPFLVEQEGKLFASEMDGTVLCYAWNEEKEVYEVRAEDNEALYNFNAQGVGSSSTLFHNYIKEDVIYGCDGSKRFFKDGLLQKWLNCHGEALIFTYDERRLKRIENGCGDFCGFNYGYGGRVSEVYTKSGAHVSYEYNTLGELVKVQLPDGACLSYEYDYLHHILREIKPHGQVLENIYDEQSRVIEQRSAMGQAQRMAVTATFEYMPGLTKVRDASGATTEYHIYDQQIYKVIDPLGAVSTQSWFIDEKSWLNAFTGEIEPYDGEGGYIKSLKQATDKRGLITQYHYDSRGNANKVVMQGDDLNGAGRQEVSKCFSFNEHDLCVLEQIGAYQTVTEYDKHFTYLPSAIKSYSGGQLTSITRFEYNDQGLLIKQDRNGSVTCFEYNDQKQLICKVEETGTGDPDVQTHYSYNYQGLCSEVVGADSIERKTYDIMGRVIEAHIFSLDGELITSLRMQYNLNGQLISKEGLSSDSLVYYDYHSSGQVKAIRQKVSEDDFAYTLYEYDTCGYLTEEVDPRGFCTYRSYDSLGHVIHERKEGVSASYTYEPGGFVATVTDGVGAKTTRVYTTNGLLKEEIYPDNTCRQLVYDELGRAIKETVKGQTWLLTYDDKRRQEIRTHASTGVKEVREFDANHHLTSQTDAAGYTTRNIYDHLGRVVEQTSALGEKTLWSYRGNLVECFYASGERSVDLYVAGKCVSHTVYDQQGLVAECQESYYDAAANLEEVMIGDQVTRTWSNSFGKPIRVELGDNVTEYEYDKCGSCIAVYKEDSTVERQLFDGLGRLVCKRYTDGATAHLVYDAASNIIEYHLPGGSQWRASYDGMGRKLHEAIYAQGKTFSDWQYEYEEGLLRVAIDPMGRGHLYSYDEMGRVTAEEVEEWQRCYTYDPRGLLTSALQTGPPKEDSWLASWLYTQEPRQNKVIREYDANGRISYEAIYQQERLVQESFQRFDLGTRHLEVNGHRRSFSYDHGRLTHLSSDRTQCAYEYGQTGELLQALLPEGVEVSASYNSSGLPTYITTSLPDKVLHQELCWDSSGRLEHYASEKREHCFSYTARGFLAGDGQHQYEFDLSEPGVGLLTKTDFWQADEIDAFGRAIEANYDAMGQTLSLSGKTCKWDPWGQLIEVSSSESTWRACYDAFGRRIETEYTESFGQTHTTQTFFDPEIEFGVIGECIDESTYWVFTGPSGIDVIEDEHGTSAVLIKNALGVLTDIFIEGQLHPVEQEGTAFGPTTASQLPTDLLSYAKSLVWHDKAVDPTGFIWLGKRHYDPMRGRFLSTDPLGYPTCLDLYGYAGGDPINYADLDGRFESPVYKMTTSTNMPGLSTATGAFINLYNGGQNLAQYYGWSDSYSYTEGSIHMGDPGIYCINGINNTDMDARSTAQMLSNYAHGAVVHGVYNATHTPLVDVIECAIGHFGGQAYNATQVLSSWEQHIKVHGPDARILEQCHSGGAFAVKQALEQAPEYIREKVTVLAIAPAVIIPKSLCFQSYNYMSKRDIVPLFDLKGFFRHGNEMRFLTPHPDAPFFDHSVQSPTFANVIQYHIDKHLRGEY